MMNHTTGPWKYFPHDPETSITGYVIETEDALEIAVTGFGFGPQEDIANARLIAAAPELKKQRDKLLAALENIHHELCDYWDYDEESREALNEPETDMIHFLESIIAQATEKE